jgi:hypothetical protein
VTHTHKNCRKIAIRALVSFSVATAFITARPSIAASLVGEFHDSHGTFRFGTMSYTVTDGATPKAGGGMALNYEYSRQLNMSSALIVGWRQVTDSASQRDGHHAAYAGMRMFPLGLGIPLTSSIGDATISMDSSYKYYGEASLGLGRLLYEPQGSADLSGESLSITFGGGVLMHFFSRWGVDFQVLYHIIQGRGGTAESLAVSGSGMSMLIGNSYLF